MTVIDLLVNAINSTLAAMRAGIPQGGKEPHAMITANVNSEGLQLPDISCDFVKLENWDTIFDFVNPNTDPIYWGYNGRYVHRLAPGGNSELIPVRNANQIFVRTPPAGGGFVGSATLYWSYYRQPK